MPRPTAATRPTKPAEADAAPAGTAGLDGLPLGTVVVPFPAGELVVGLADEEVALVAGLEVEEGVVVGAAEVGGLEELLAVVAGGLEDGAEVGALLLPPLPPPALTDSQYLLAPGRTWVIATS